MESHDDPIHKEKKGKQLIEKCKSKSAKSDPSEIGRTYGIDHLNLGESTHNLDNNSARILTQRMKFQMANKVSKDSSITHVCNVLSNLLNPTKHAISKIDNYSPILQGCMNTLSGSEKFRKFRILLDIRISSTIVMGKMESKIKQKNIRDKYVGNTSREVHKLK